MNSVQKKVNTFINSSILVSLGFFVLGVVFLAMPSLSLDIIRWVIAIGSLVIGTILVAADLGRHRTFPFFSTTIAGIVLLIIGLVFIRHPRVMDIFPILLGAIFIINPLHLAVSLQPFAEPMLVAMPLLLLSLPSSVACS